MVSRPEPLAHSYLHDHRGRPDLIVIPHVAGQTEEALLAAGITCRGVHPLRVRVS